MAAATPPEPMSIEQWGHMPENPIAEAFNKDEEAERRQRELREWESKRLGEIHNAVLDFDNFQPGVKSAVKRRQIIMGMIDVQLNRQPKTEEEYELARGVLAKKFMQGEGLEDDEAVFNGILKASQKKKAGEDLDRSIRDAAFAGTLDGRSFADWAASQGGKMSEPRKQSLQFKYNEYQRQVREQFGEPLKYARNTFKALSEQDPGEALAYADRIMGNMTTEEKETFLGLFREVVLSNPNPTVDQIMDAAGIDSKLIRNATKAGRNIGKSFTQVGDMFGSAADVAEEVVAGVPTPKGRIGMPTPTADILQQSVFGVSPQDRERVRAVKEHNAFMSELKGVMRNDYDPIEPVFEDGFMGAVESGIYAAPSAVATSAVMMIPYIGLPAAGAMIFGSTRDTYRGRLRAAGWDMDQAIDTSNKLGMIASVPMMMMERVQAKAWMGKVPGLEKALSVIDNKVNNLVLRTASRFTLANVAETNIEMGQEYVMEMIQDIAGIFNEEIPDVEWMNGKDGVFDGFFNQYVSTFVAVAPLGFSAAIGGFNKEARAEAFSVVPRDVREMAGVRPEDNDKIDNAQTVAEKVEAVETARLFMDPNSDEAKAAVERHEANARKAEADVKALQQQGDFPIIRTSKESEGVVEIVDPQSGEIIDRIDNSPSAAAEAIASYMEVREEATQDQLDEIAGMIEVATLDVKAAEAGAKVEMDLGTSMDVQGLLEMFPQYAKRVQEQADRLEALEGKERLNGGDGMMSRAVYGMSKAERFRDSKAYIQRIWGGTSAMTIVHERGHVSFKQALESGAVTMQQTFDFFKNLDKALAGKKSKKGEELRFLPEGATIKDTTAIDEAVAEFMEVMLLRTKGGQKTGMREAVGRQLSAMVRARVPGATQFKAFYDAMLEFFGKVLSRHFYIKQAIKSGQITEAQIDDFHAALAGEEAIDAFDQDVEAEAREIMNEDPFSIGDMPAEIAESKEPAVRHIYLKEDAKFHQAREEGRLDTGVSIEEFAGKQLMLHQPDTAMAGEVVVEGRRIVQGKGGVYYPLLFAEQKYVWASTAAKAIEMADNLNEISRRNGGKILLGLTSAGVDKLFSSTTMSTGTLNFFETLTHNPEKYGLTADFLSDTIAEATGVVVVKGKTKQQFKTRIEPGQDLETVMEQAKEMLDPRTSQFPVRKAFVERIMTKVADKINEDPAKAQAVADILFPETNKYARPKWRKGGLSKPAFIQGLGDMLTEPFVKTFQQLDRQTGMVYAIIEIDGEVEAVEADEHDSYPMAVRSKTGLSPKVHVLDKAYHWSEVTRDKATGQAPEKKLHSSYYPPSAGVSSVGKYELEISEIPADAEGIDLAFSIGDTQMKTALADSALERAKDPKAKAEVMLNIVEKLLGLKRDVPKIIKAFGKEYLQQPIVDRRLMGELKGEMAQRRREAIEDVENAVYEQYGEILSNEDLTNLKAQPVTEFILSEGGMESLSAAKRRKGDQELVAGEYEEAAGLPTMYYGGGNSPDQMARLAASENIGDGTVATLMELVEKEITSVSNRKEDLKKAKAMLREGKAKAREESQAWLDERIAEQERDYNPMARARRAMVTLSAIRRSLPMEIRGKIDGSVKLLTIASDEKRLEYLEETLEKVDKVVDQWVKGELNKSIDQTFDRVHRSKKKLTADTQQKIDDIKKMAAMTSEQVSERMTELNALINEETDTERIEEMEDELVDLVGYGNRRGMTAQGLASFLENILSIEEFGKTLNQLKREEFKARVKSRSQIVVNDVTGGKGQMTDRDRQLAREKEDKWWKKLDAFHQKNVSFEFLLNRLSRNSRGTETLKSDTNNVYGTMVHVATQKEKTANLAFFDGFESFMSGLLGLKGLRLKNAIAREFMEPTDTGIYRTVYEGGKATKTVTIEAQTLQNILAGDASAEALGLTEKDVMAAQEAFNAKRTKLQALKKNQGKIVTVPPTTKLKFETEAKGEQQELRKSQSQAIAMIMMFKQEGIRESMIAEGYTEETMQKLEDEFLTEESVILMDYLADQYEANYHVVNEVYRKQHGVNLPKIEYYAPVRRIVDQKVAEEMEIAPGREAFSANPSFLMDRVKNFNEIDPDVDALNMFNRHMLQTNHYVAWADPIKEMRAVFGNKENRKAIRDYAGKQLLNRLDERIGWMADGGNRKAGHSEVLDKLRLAHTFTSLGYNIGVGLKQLTSLPAYAFDMGLKDWAKYQAKFMLNPVKNLQSMWNTQYVQNRFREGYTRDVAEGLKRQGETAFGRLVWDGLQKGMLVGKVGDIIPVMIGGWAAREKAYDDAIADGYSDKEAKLKAEITFEMATDRAQQAVDMKDLSSFQGGGSFTKLFTMYKTSPRQYYANMAEALMDATSGRKGAVAGAARRIFIANIVLPVVFQFASDMWNMADEEEQELNPSEYFRAVLLGPLNGVFLVGEALAPLAALATGAKVWDAKLPIYDTINDIHRGVKEFTAGEFWQGVDETAEAIGKLGPSPLSFYSIMKKRADDFIDWD